jgi:hypothetical protein
MSNELAHFNPSNYAEAIRQKIKIAMLEVIPEEQWRKMIEAEIRGYIEPRVGNRYNFDSHRGLSEFEKDVRYACAQEIEARMKAYFATPEWASEWDSDNGRLKVGQKVEEFLLKNSSQILTSWLGQAFQNMIPR